MLKLACFNDFPLVILDIQDSILYFCYHCGWLFECLNPLRKHIKKKHMTRKIVSPALRNSSYEISKCRLESGFVSSTCRRKTKTKKYLSKMCPHCDFCSSSSVSPHVAKGNLKRHIMELHGQRQYPCEQCKTTFTRKQDRDEHIISKHTPKENWTFKCHLCDYCAVKK